MPPEVLDAVLNPDKLDPLSFAASDALRGLAEGKSIVACLPDSLVRYAHIASSGTNVQLGAFEAAARDLGDIEFKREGDWFQVRSADPLRDEGLRLSRAALGDLLRGAYRKREMTARDFAIYKHRANGIEVSSTIDHLYATLAAQAGAPPPFAYYRVPGGLWRLLGTLPDGQWNALMEGQTIPVGRLAEARRRVPEWARFTGERTPDEYGAQASDLWLDVTECVPTGIPNEATLRLGLESRDVLQRLDSPNPTEMDSYMGPQARPLSEVADFLDAVASESKATDPFSLMQSRYRIGTQSTQRFILHLAQGVQVTSALELRPKVADGPGVPWAELPESYRSAVDRHLKDLAKKRATGEASGTIPFK